jgi:hypothetical protein
MAGTCGELALLLDENTEVLPRPALVRRLIQKDRKLVPLDLRRKEDDDFVNEVRKLKTNSKLQDRLSCIQEWVNCAVAIARR